MSKRYSEEPVTYFMLTLEFCRIGKAAMWVGQHPCRPGAYGPPVADLNYARIFKKSEIKYLPQGWIPVPRNGAMAMASPVVLNFTLKLFRKMQRHEPTKRKGH